MEEHNAIIVINIIKSLVTLLCTSCSTTHQSHCSNSTLYTYDHVVISNAAESFTHNHHSGLQSNKEKLSIDFQFIYEVIHYFSCRNGNALIIFFHPVPIMVDNFTENV